MDNNLYNNNNRESNAPANEALNTPAASGMNVSAASDTQQNSTPLNNTAQNNQQQNNAPLNTAQYSTAPQNGNAPQYGAPAQNGGYNASHYTSGQYGSVNGGQPNGGNPNYGGQYGSHANYGSPDFSRYSGASSDYSSIPNNTVYIGNKDQKKKKDKAPKGRLGIGAIAAVVAVCMVFSGGAAFVGTMAANRLNASSVPTGTVDTGTTSSGTSAGTPSVIFQSFDNTNKTAGTYKQVAEAVTPTVVEIVTESVSTATTFWGGNYVTSGAGSGVIISSDGLIITNNHVVSGANTIKVTLKDGTQYDASLVGTDSDSDIAVIKIDATGLPCALVGNSDKLEVGDEVVAVGNPLGELGGTVTNGIISALSRDVNISGTEMTLIQTNAAVNPGNSGGGLFNMYGELIGIVNAKSTNTSSGTAVEGIGFAIPVNSATNVAEELVNYGYVRGKVMLGITYVEIDNAYDAMRYGVSDFGIYVVSSEYTDELRSGDRIVAVDDTQISDSSDLKGILQNHSDGDVLTLKVVRGGQYYDIKVTLHEYVPSSASNSSGAAKSGN